MELWDKAMPYVAVVLLQFGYAGAAIFSKSALNHGMSHYTFAAYRNIFAAAAFTPFAVVFERNVRPKMTLSVMWKIMLLALLEPVIDENLFYEAMKYTTATYSTAMTNMLPAITFLFAWLLRLEDVNIKELTTRVKILGTILTVGGAMIMTLVTGRTIVFPWTRDDDHAHGAYRSQTHDRPIEGALMITVACLSWGAFYNLQVITLKSYPAGLSLTSLVCTAGAVQATVLTLVAERNHLSVWSLGWNRILLSYVYSGIVSSGVGYYFSGIIMKRKGPVFLTAFIPLTMIIVAILGSFFLHEKLTYGSIFGAIVIVVGLYLVIWSKRGDHHVSSSGNTNNIAEMAINKESLEMHCATTSPKFVKLVKDQNIEGHDEV